MCGSKSALGLHRDQTNIDSPWQSWSQSQKFHWGPDCLVSCPAKMAPDWTKPNFPKLVETTNQFKWRVNKDKQAHHDGPLHDHSVSSDEEEEEVPDCLTFDTMAQVCRLILTLVLMQLPVTRIYPLIFPTLLLFPLVGLTLVSWLLVLKSGQISRMLPTMELLTLPHFPLLHSSLAMTLKLWSTFSNRTLCGQNTAWICAVFLSQSYRWLTSDYLCHFHCSPLLLLTESNSTLISNSTKSYLASALEIIPSLDVSTFPDELLLSDTEFWQAYYNWLALINIIVEPAVVEGWKLHHAHMMSDRNFSTLFPSWHEHDHLLHACFMVDLFVINLDHASYVHQFERCQGDQTHTDSLSLATTLRRDVAPNYVPKYNLFQPYNQTSPRTNSFWPSLCICCGAVGHKASECQATSLTVLNRCIVINWKANHLVSKMGQLICLIFTYEETCTHPQSSSHGAHSCSLCGDKQHPACHCSWNWPHWGAVHIMALTLCSLTSEFPNLVHDIKFGSTIGNPPPLSTTFLLWNLPTADVMNTIDFGPHLSCYQVEE